MKKILITGANGFIGRNCIEILKNCDVEVHAISRKKKISENNIKYYIFDLLKDNHHELIKEIKPSHLLHLAWVTKPKVYWHSKNNLDWLSSSINFAREFTESGGKKIVCAGTCAEYDWNFGFCSENITPISPNSLYGECKNKLNQFLLNYCSNNEVEYIWGRIFFMFGENEHKSKLVASVINKLIKNKIAYCSQGTQIRDFLHVGEVASIFIKLLLQDESINSSINICSGEGIAIKKLVNKIGDYLDKRDLIKFSSEPLPENEPPLLIGNNTKLFESINLKNKFDLNEKLIETIEWWKNFNQD